MSTPGESPFQIAITDDQLSLLKQKLALTTFPDELNEAEWNYGSPLADIKRLVAYWKDGFDWRKQEALLNAQLPQFTRDLEVEGHGTFNIHYVHKQSDVKGAIPLLKANGKLELEGPGSFFEASKILPLLIEASPDHPSFHVVVISLPGFGFSTAPSKKGFGIPQYSEVSHKLMLSLGYDEYVTQGGDWGYRITRKIAQLYGPKHSKAWHTNFPIKREYKGIERTQWFQSMGRGYYAEQSTRPQTLGYSLADSPAGLLAWIYEKLVQWTDDYKWTDDEVLTWISIYYFSRAGPAASIRIYYEAVQAAGGIDLFRQVEKTTTPLGYSYFPKELAIFPKSWTRQPNLVFEADHDEGGHFAAYEKPDLLVGDLRKMFGRGGGAFQVVKDKSGYDV
ncbi:hypothetical protein H0H92_002503 [Tricholoma furcatifolium]|nr:hypothetical protein H0H92_002503 [Tricholoma furcatifolium]